MSEKFREQINRRTNWVKLIQEPGTRGNPWERKRKNSPVVKMTYEHGVIQYGVLGALVEERGEMAVTGINFEVSEEGVPSCITGYPLVEDLERGEIELRGSVKIKIEFAGLASDPDHKGKRWSYWN